MDPALLHGAAGLRALEKKYEVVTQNLSNANTPGYKRFNSVQEITQRGSTSYPKVSVERDFSQGDLLQNGNYRELALRGEGYFLAEDGQGLKLARHVTFSVTEAGGLVLSDGSQLMGSAGPVTVPAGARELVVQTDGRVLADGVPRGSFGSSSPPRPTCSVPNPGLLPNPARQHSRGYGCGSPSRDPRTIERSRD